MRTIRVSVSTGYVNSTVTDEFEVDDNATEEEINKIALEVREEMIDYYWCEADNK